MGAVPAGLGTALQDRYRLDREVGQGGMAMVYLARDLKHDRDVAIKVLRPDLAAALGAEPFLAEVKITARLDHPHILTLIDSGTVDGNLYILLHEGEAILTDFGIALAVSEAGGDRLTGTGLSLGTPSYMSPEQAAGDRHVDARSDIYALGAVTYEMLAGEPPVTGATMQAMIAKLMTERPTPLRVLRDTVPAAVDTAVMRALAKAPIDCFATARTERTPTRQLAERAPGPYFRATLGHPCLLSWRPT
jgi:serine/threonine-protein kinase